MQLFRLATDPDRYRPLRVTAESDLDLFIDGFDGHEMAPSWPAPSVGLSDDALPVGDFASVFGAVVAFSERAKSIYDPHISGFGEWLPLSGAPFWVFNAMTECDVLDREASERDFFAPDRVMDLRRLAVRHLPPGELPMIFKIPEWRKGPALITQAFVGVAESDGLTGLDARLLTSA